MQVLSARLEALRSQCLQSLNGHGNRTSADFLADLSGDIELDRYGAGGVVAELEDFVAKLLGKPAALFLPSGTMAQQIALRIHASDSESSICAFHPTCHLQIHEEDAYQWLQAFTGLPVGQSHRLLSLHDIAQIQKPLAAMLFELPQREIGGQLPSWSELNEQVAEARRLGAKIHLDGARLWECTPFYQRSLSDICQLFDSVYVSFYKGLGGLAGCCLVGEKDLIDTARVWRRRYGGTLFGLWPNAASALSVLRRRLPLMPAYVEHAQAIARALAGGSHISVRPNNPPTPMMHFEFAVQGSQFLQNAINIAEDQGIFTWSSVMPGRDPESCRVEFVVGDATLNLKPQKVAELLSLLAENNSATS